MSYNGRFHPVEIEGVTRHLPLFKVAPDVNIAIFNMLGDTEIVEASAKGLAKLMPAETDVIVVPEVKAVPLAQALGAQLDLPYVVVRKVRKPYMVECLEVEVLSITTGKPQTLYIDGKDRELVTGKNVALVDDVISTGSTLDGLRLLMEKAEANVVVEMAVFTEGEEDDWEGVVALGHLPIFAD
jgi:adenine phosphoribosyltransferase